jgi:arsenate reductase
MNLRTPRTLLQRDEGHLTELNFNSVGPCRVATGQPCRIRFGSWAPCASVALWLASIKIIGLFALLVVGGTCVSCMTHQPARIQSQLLPALEPYVVAVAGELEKVGPERRAVLEAIATDLAAQLERGKPAKLTYICTHNSRRSHMSQIWAQTAACYYGLDRVHAYSGGTQVTACNCRTVTAMRRAGFTIEDATTGDNPLYLVYYATDRPPVRAYSKLYDARGNPQTGFVALMTCSAADRSCPNVRGAIARHAIHYADPRLCDDTPTETAAYNERCREIAREMFYLMSEVKRRRLVMPSSGS